MPSAMTQICSRHGCRKQALRKFCSDACRIAHHNGRRPPAPKVKITCQGCGSVFQGRPDQKTCGATCRSRLFRLRHLSADQQSSADDSLAIDWVRSTPFSPAELRERVQIQKVDAEVEYSWLPKPPKPVRVRKNRDNADQLHLDFGLPADADAK